MSIFSKHFKDAIVSYTCKDIVHPQTDSCLLGACEYFTKPIATAVQFFLPLFLVFAVAQNHIFLMYFGTMLKVLHFTLK